MITPIQAAQNYSDAQKKPPEKPFWEILMESRPEFSSNLSAEGLLDPKYQMNTGDYTTNLQKQLDAISLDKRGLDSFRNEALRTGPSAWYNMMVGKQGLEEQSAKDAAARQALSGNAQSRAALAMKGGLSGGAAERLARSGTSDLLRARQEVGRQGVMNRAQFGISDEEKRMQALSQLPGMEIAALQPELQKTQMWNAGQQTALNAQQWNLQKALEEKKRKDDFEMAAWNQKAQGMATERSAQATENSGK